MNLIQRGATWLGDRMQQLGGRSVRIKRGALQSLPITAWQDRKTYDAEGDDGLETSYTLDIWTFHADELIINGKTIELRPGDFLTETLNGVDIEYQVMPTPNEPGQAWFDTSGLLVLVYTKRVA